MMPMPVDTRCRYMLKVAFNSWMDFTSACVSGGSEERPTASTGAVFGDDGLPEGATVSIVWSSVAISSAVSCLGGMGMYGTGVSVPGRNIGDCVPGHSAGLVPGIPAGGPN